MGGERTTSCLGKERRGKRWKVRPNSTIRRSEFQTVGNPPLGGPQEVSRKKGEKGEEGGSGEEKRVKQVFRHGKE